MLGGGATLVWLSFLNLNTGYWDIFWPQFLQGISLSLLFVPLTTVTMDSIPRDQMGNATSLFNLMRNLGGSVGIAVAATMTSRGQQTFTNILGAHVTPYDQQSVSMLQNLRAMYLAAGADLATAQLRAEAAVFGLVQRHAAMLSFIDVFRFMGGLFLLMLPLIFLFRRPKHQRAPVGAH
jgi:DHA2 family multidrug resistance protein